MAESQIVFYATTADINFVLSNLEITERLQYTRAGLLEINRLQSYFSYVDIPYFGRTTHPNAVGNPAYLLSNQSAQISIRDVPQKRSGVLFAIDQLENPDSVVLRPGGNYGNEVILCGMVGTVSRSLASTRLYGLAAKAFRKHFVKQREFLVGPEAREAWNAGVRLTIGASSPMEFDLKRDS